MDDAAVVVSGASTGIGRATALHLDSLGLRVFAGVRRTEDGEELRRDAINRLTPLRLDVTDSADVARAAEIVGEAVRDSRLVGIVNNAGIAVAGPVEFVPLDMWRQQLEINVFGVVGMIQAFMPLLRENRGRIVTTGSLGGRLAQPMAAPYCASKHALEAIHDALRIELRPWGIGVSLLEPGAVKTPIWNKGVQAGSELLRHAPPQLRELYGAAVEIATKTAIHENETGVEPIEVARAVEHALLAARPRPRYRIGRQARILIPLTRFMPDRLKDELILRVSGLPRTADGTGRSGPRQAPTASSVTAPV
ncbi:MAG: SDR family oxidoreductase [Candidatus Dormibacter sp.]